MSEFRMPSLGADMEHGTVVQWRVAPGASVKRGDIIADIETEKGVFEVESPVGGVVADLVVAKGTKVPVGTLLAHLEAAGVALPAGTMPTAAGVPAPTVVGAGPAAPAPAPPAPVVAEPPAPVVAAPPVPPSAPPTPAPAIPTIAAAPARPHASPLAKRVAADLDVDLATVVGTGPDGAITRADVEHAAAATAVSESRATPAAPAATPTSVAAPATHVAPSATVDESRRAMRQAIARAVSRSKREIPHYYLAADIDLANATAWLQKENLRRPVTERLLPGALFLKAVALALRAFPALNGSWQDDAPRPGAGIHVGVAIALRGGGLVAPAIHDLDTLPLPSVMASLQDLVRRARGGGLRGSEMTDATITVTSLGDEGAEKVYGVIYPPQLAIIGFGRVVERPWAVNGMLAVRPIVSVTLGADHRATDGHYGGRFLAVIDRLLQKPEAL